jgi:hypothetical protein
MAPPDVRDSVDAAAYFAALLDRVVPTKGCINGFRSVALAHVQQFRQIWLAIRGAVNACGSEPSDKTLATWLAVDAVLQDAPAVYGMYVSRELPGLCRRLMPFSESWAAPMLRSWVPLLPGSSQIGAVADEAAAEYAQAQLESELSAAALRAGIDDTSGEPATADDMRDLQDATERVLAAVLRKRKASQSVRVKLESVKAEPGLVKQERAAMASMRDQMKDVGNSRGEAIDADEDYTPDYVAGASMGRLRREQDKLAAEAKAGPARDGAPATAAAGLPPGTKREKRVRPRNA